MCINTAKQYTATMVTDIGHDHDQAPGGTKTRRRSTTSCSWRATTSTTAPPSTGWYRLRGPGRRPDRDRRGRPGVLVQRGAPKSASVYTAGALAMANSGSSSSDGSQFFIVVGKGGAELQPLYSYFGQVTSGMSVVNKIKRRRQPIVDGHPEGRPQDPQGHDQRVLRPGTWELGLQLARA